MSKIGKIIFYGIVIALLLLTFIFIFGIENTKAIQQTKNSTGVNIGLYLSYALAGLGVLGIAAIAIKGMIDKPKSAIKVGIGLAVALVIYAIGYMIDAGTTNDVWAKFGVETSSSSKKIGASLIMMYISLIGGLLLIIFGPFLRLIKK